MTQYTTPEPKGSIPTALSLLRDAVCRTVESGNPLANPQNQLDLARALGLIRRGDEAGCRRMLAHRARYWEPKFRGRLEHAYWDFLRPVVVFLGGEQAGERREVGIEEGGAA